MPTSAPIHSVTFDNDKWTRWIMQTSRKLHDLEEFIKKIGIDRVDEDHELMTGRVLHFNNLLDQIDSEGISMEIIEQLKELLDELYVIAEDHFSREEKIIRKFEIEGLKEHHAQHQNFLRLLREYSHNVLSGEFQKLHGLKLFILEWWVDHINDIDFKAFCSGNWTTKILTYAEKWDDIKDIIRSMRVEVIDRDHRQLAEYTLQLNGLIDAMEAGTINAEDKQFVELFQKMRNFADEHFQREERIIAKYNLSGLEDQQYNHQFLLSCFDAYIEDLLGSRIAVNATLKASVLELWINHINEVDYNTFRKTPWVGEALAEAKQWEDISDLIYHTGIKEVDKQHRAMAEYMMELNYFIESHEKGAKQTTELEQKLDNLFQKLHDSAILHFQTEERILKEREHPRYPEHKHVHQEFLTTLNYHRKLLREKKSVPSKNLKTFFLDWWIQHINGIDHETLVIEKLP